RAAPAAPPPAPEAYGASAAEEAIAPMAAEALAEAAAPEVANPADQAEGRLAMSAAKGAKGSTADAKRRVAPPAPRSVAAEPMAAPALADREAAANGGNIAGADP